jgi:hypothetical protein
MSVRVSHSSPVCRWACRSTTSFTWVSLQTTYLHAVLSHPSLVGNSYRESTSTSRYGRVRDALLTMAISVLSASITTMLSAFVLVFTTVVRGLKSMAARALKRLYLMISFLAILLQVWCFYHAGKLLIKLARRQCLYHMCFRLSWCPFAGRLSSSWLGSPSWGILSSRTTSAGFGTQLAAHLQTPLARARLFKLWSWMSPRIHDPR